MPKLPFTRAFAGICIVLPLFAQGCATTPENTVPSREELGTVGIVAVGLAPTPEALGPIGPGGEAGRGAERGAPIGAGSGAAAGFAVGLACGPGFWICSPILAFMGAAGGVVVGAAGGAVIGVAEALPEETAAELEAVLVAALEDRVLSAELSELIVERSVANESAVVVDLGISEVSEVDATLDYDGFDTAGANTVLELGIAQIGLTREQRGDAPFSLLMVASARLVRVSDHEVLWSEAEIPTVSPPEQLAAWTAPSGDLLQSEINAGLERLALRIHGQIFGLT